MNLQDIVKNAFTVDSTLNAALFMYVASVGYAGVKDVRRIFSQDYQREKIIPEQETIHSNKDNQNNN